MPNPNIYYKEINELLRKFDVEIEKSKKITNSTSYTLLSIDLENNEIGINSDNIDSIVTTLRKYIIITQHPSERDTVRYFLKMHINSNIISEIKHLHRFDFKSYVNKIEEVNSTATSAKYAAWASVGVAIISVGISYSQYKSNQETSDRLTEKYNQAKKSIDSLSRIQAKMQLHTTGQEDSLKISERKP